ncbi:PREDICTED: multiple myeloma tumor-associated protein 2 homolog [Prunus mume]|uniref:Multiple myeloma tumor-associated protein 2 homolog n=1 Tax=Prunus mume TaxID=102107 RepID=A0ABM0PDV5_PRUMU|nr:PREDICTED: multiple myeloma tumor-associated protein 2 homolog [Prunus mume]XP_016650987.1 PREDICTED: multiple myeloma tumor-associated protein 2 homolog [Prunus mume]
MYHPTRGGVRGGRDQFSWDDVKVDKHRENYLGHSIKAPVGRWQKGKDLHWYTKDKKTQNAEMEAAKEEIKRIKDEEEQAMREALGLAPKRASRGQGNRLDKHEFSELVKRGSTAEDLGEGHAEAARVHGLGFSRAPCPWDESSSLPSTVKDAPPEMGNMTVPDSPPKEKNKEELDDESSRKKRRREERKQEKHERREKREKHGKQHSSDERRKHKKHKEKRRHDSDSE